jgi:hypothetical protein
MSGSAASLGLRSGSYGSLTATVAGSGGAGRKSAGGARGWAACRGEKERLHRALRLVGRRRAGVLLLLAVASAAVFCSLFTVVKGEVPPPLPTLLIREMGAILIAFFVVRSGHASRVYKV